MQAEEKRSESQVILEAESISLSFGGVNALLSLDFKVGKGEIYSIIGPNGAGKSSLFNVISGLYRPQRGRILFKDRDITALPPHKIAFLVYEPDDLAHRWQMVKAYWKLWPFS